MGIKLIVTDLDGTLLRTDKTVSEETIQVLQKCREQTDRIIDMMQEAVPEAEIVSAADRTMYWNCMHISESDRLYRRRSM